MFPLYGFVLGVVVFMLGARQIRLLELSSCPQKSVAQCSSWYQGFLLWGSSLFSSRFGHVTKSEHCFEILLAIITSLFFGHLWLFGLQGWYYWAAQALVCILAIRYAGDVFFANMLLACLFQLPLVPTWVGESAYKFWVGFFLVARFFYADNWGHYAKNIAHSLILLLLIRQDDLLLLVLYAVLLVFFAISALWARFTWQSIFDSLGLANIFAIAFVGVISTLTISLPISFPAFLLPFFAIGYVLIGSWPSLPSKYFPQNEPASEPSGM